MKKEESSIAVKAMTIVIGKKELALSLHDARKLYEALGDIFRTRTEYVNQYPWWNRPYYSTSFVGNLGIGGMTGTASNVNQALQTFESPKISLTTDSTLKLLSKKVA